MYTTGHWAASLKQLEHEGNRSNFEKKSNVLLFCSRETRRSFSQQQRKLLFGDSDFNLTFFLILILRLKMLFVRKFSFEPRYKSLKTDASGLKDGSVCIFS